MIERYDPIGSSSINKRTFNKGKSVKNADLVEYPFQLEELNKWTIPRVSMHLLLTSLRDARCVDWVQSLMGVM